MDTNPGTDSDPGKCTHPRRGGQEHYLSAGTGDNLCAVCKEPMPKIVKPTSCIECHSTSGAMVPDPTHGRSWHCTDCGKNWGWVP